MLSAHALAPFGVEVRGDLSVPLSEREQAWLRDMLDRHGIIVAHRQALTLQQQFALLEGFGPILGRPTDMHYVAPDDGILHAGALAFHSDLAFAPRPFDAISLHALDVEDGETMTRFASGRLAWEKLDDATRERLGSLTARAVCTAIDIRRVHYDVSHDATAFDRDAVLAHPRTGEPILYVNEGQTARFNELPREESDSLLERLFAMLYAPGMVLEHRWKCGDLVIWDNIALTHGRPELAGVTRRRLQRVVVAEAGLRDQLPDFFDRAGMMA